VVLCKIEIKRIQYPRQPRSKSTEGLISRQLYLSRFATNPCLGSRLWNGRCAPYSRPLAEPHVPVIPPVETLRKPQGSSSRFLLHGKRVDLLRTYPHTYPFLFHHTIFIFSLFILLQALHASLPPFAPTRLLPLIAWSPLLPAFSLAFYFIT